MDYKLIDIQNTNIRLLLQAAEKLGIKWTMVDDDRYEILLEKGNQAHKITAHTLGLNSHEAIVASKSKAQVLEKLKKNNIPTLSQVSVSNLSFPLAVKPAEGQKGREVYLNLGSQAVVENALTKVLKKYDAAVIEPYFSGRDIRILCLNHQVIGIAERHAPQIKSDGKHTIEQLIKTENQRRTILNNQSGIRLFNRFLCLERIIWYLEKQGLALASIPAKGKIIRLHEVPNYSAGGWVETLNKNQVHPTIIKLAEKVSKLSGLTVVGIDLIVKDLKQTKTQENCVVLELNSDPGLRLHDLPNKGFNQHVSEKVLKIVFAKPQSS